MSDTEDLQGLDNLKLVKGYLSDLGLNISKEVTEEQLGIVDDESRGLKNLVIDCEDSILILEQFIVLLKSTKEGVFKNVS